MGAPVLLSAYAKGRSAWKNMPPAGLCGLLSWEPPQHPVAPILMEASLSINVSCFLFRKRHLCMIQTTYGGYSFLKPTSRSLNKVYLSLRRYLSPSPAWPWPSCTPSCTENFILTSKVCSREPGLKILLMCSWS